MKTLTIICPAYNEEDVIKDFYMELKKVLTGLANMCQSRIIFVVDRSSDATMNILKDLAEEDPATQILGLSSRFGHQASLLAGLDHTDSDMAIMMDSDLQHPPSLIPRLIDEFEKGYDVVYTIREYPSDVGLTKRLTSKIYYWIINHFSDVHIRENAADFRLLSRRIVEIFQRDLRERNLFLRGLIGWMGFKSVEVPFKAGTRPRGRSKYSTSDLFKLGGQSIIYFSKKPLKAAVFLGLTFAALGLLYALFTLFQYLFDSSLPSGWATIVMLISIFSGIQLIFLGIIGEYIGAIFDETKKRPHYLVEEKINFLKNTKMDI